MRSTTLHIVVLFFFLSSCVKEDYFGYSNYANIKVLEVSNQASQTVIITGENKVIVEIPGGVDLTQIVLQKLELSSFATADVQVGDILNLEAPISLKVTAEDGSVQDWILEALVASVTPQLANGDLNLWYKTNSDYFEPGESKASTIWGTGNQGTFILNKLATVPYDLGNDNLAAQMITLDNGFLGSTFGAPIAAGSIFTGVFNSDNLDPKDPEAAIDFGTPFSGRPEKIQFTYSYVPGEENKDKDGELLPYSDQMDVYAILEVRTGDKIERLATAWLRSGEVQQELVTISLDFIYGELDDSYPTYMLPQNSTFVSQDSAGFILPTHITFVASSSFDGALFAGAVGSSLIVDDIVMIYE